MKKWGAVLLAAVLLMLVGCGTETQSETVSMYDLRQAMEAADSSLPEMLNASSAEENGADNFSYISDLDYDKVDSYFVSYASDGHKADEIAVIAVKDTADLADAKKSLEDHKQSRHDLLASYEPEQVSRIDKGIVFTQGQYAVLIISDNSDAVRGAFEDAVSK